MSLYDNVTDDFITRDVFTCESCKFVNITNVKTNPKRKKKLRTLYSDDPTWFSLKSGAALLEMTMADFLSFLNGLYQRERNRISEVGVRP